MVIETSAPESAQRDTRLDGRIAIITGASSGLGRATAHRFAASGARIVCADLTPGPSSSIPIDQELNDKFGDDRAIFVQVDVTSEPQIQGMVERAVAWAGRLDIICNYAGIATEIADGHSRRLHETSTESFDRTFAVNTRGVWLCCKHALRQMLSQDPRPPNARGERTRGWIVNAASILGLVAVENTACYVPSKHAVVGLTRQIALDYARDRIHCNALCPGFVESPMIKDIIGTKEGYDMIAGLHPWNSLGRAEDIADAALFLASDEAAWVSGHAMVIDGGYTAR